MSELNSKLQDLRVSYKLAKLDVDDCSANPLDQFNHWLHEAISSKCDEPNAFTLSTASNGQPRGRVLLLKGLHEGKFLFYTNYSSAKGHEIQNNDRVAMTFLWLPLQRQIRIEGVITKADEKLSDDYFQKRPRGSQLGAIASPQSKKISSRSELERIFKETEEKFKDTEVLPRPGNWGGLEVSPTYFEFWQGRENRLHDRICYEIQGSAWVRSRLAP